MTYESNYQEVEITVEDKKQRRTLLDKVLADARPVVFTNIKTFELKTRPTELSSGGYVDYA